MQGSKKKNAIQGQFHQVHFVMAEIDEFFAVLVLCRSTIQNVDDGFASFLIRNVTGTNELLLHHESNNQIQLSILSEIGYKWTKSSLSIIPVVALCCIMQNK